MIKKTLQRPLPSNCEMTEFSLSVRQYSPSDEPTLIELWQTCQLTRPWNDPARDIRRKLDGQCDWLLVGLIDDTIIGSVMIGYDGHRGWINYLAVHPHYRNSGIGRKLMIESEHRLRRIGCPKINLQVRADNEDAIAFYQAIGFQKDNVLSFGKRLIIDDPPNDDHDLNQ